MADDPPMRLVLFRGASQIAKGDYAAVSAAFRKAAAAQPDEDLRAFDVESGRPIDLDPREVEAPGSESEPARRGRPRLGVVAREVTLLPRHWKWLSERPGGASVTLRRLVDEARKATVEVDRGRKRAEAAYQFMHAMCGDRPGFEEASRALFAGDLASLRHGTATWPDDIRLQIDQLLGDDQN